MIVFEDIMGMLSKRGWSSYRLRHEKILSESIMSRLRSEESITTNTIDKLCELLDCQPGDLIHYVPDEQGE